MGNDHERHSRQAQSGPRRLHYAWVVAFCRDDMGIFGYCSLRGLSLLFLPFRLEHGEPGSAERSS